jgi:hypothetical protein
MLLICSSYSDYYSLLSEYPQEPICWWLVCQPMPLLEDRGTLGVESSGRELGHWQHGVEGDTGTPASSSLFSLSISLSLSLSPPVSFSLSRSLTLLLSLCSQLPGTPWVVHLICVLMLWLLIVITLIIFFLYLKNDSKHAWFVCVYIIWTMSFKQLCHLH